MLLLEQVGDMSLELQAAFFRQVGLPGGWAARQHWTFLDTDFHEGLRFLLLWDLWRRDPHRPSRLHVVALVPALPEAGLLREHLLAQLPASLHDKVDSLLEVWPIALAGVHRMDFDEGAVTLTLGVGPVPVLLHRLCMRADLLFLHAGALEECLTDAVVAGRLLGGLAHPGAVVVMPIAQADCLQALERVGLLSQPARPSTSQSSTAFCMAQVVRTESGPADAWTQQARPDARQAIVVGAGFAGLSVARALALRGWRVTVFDPDWRDDGTRPHARHVAAALTPVASRDDNIRARLSRAGSLRAQAVWRHFPESVVTRCGAIQLQRDSGRIVDLAQVVRTLAMNPAWIQYLTATQAADRAGVPITRPGIYFPTAMRVQPQALLEALAATPGVTVRDGRVRALDWQDAGHWLVRDEAGQTLATAQQVVLSCGAHVRTILAESDLLASGARVAALHALGGEITMIPQDAVAGGPRCIIGGDGYVLPAMDGWCVTGSSYVHGAVAVDVTQEGARGNVRRAAGLLGQPELPEKLAANLAAKLEVSPAVNQLSHIEDSPDVAALPGWGGWRAVLPGRLPAIGPIHRAQGLWVTTGYASRGLTWACLAADLIVAALEGEPLPLERDLLEAIDAN